MTGPSLNPEISHEDALRLGTYSVLGALLAQPPSKELLEQLAAAGGDSESDALGRAWTLLAAEAQKADVAAVRQEHNDVFIGITQGEITPYASWYLHGSLMERPLIQVRQALDELGVQRNSGVKEPEDHGGALLETMALLINAADVDFEREQRFFQQHLEPWLAQCFRDIQEAPSAAFYAPVGQLGEAFMSLESQYYRMPV